MSILGSNNNMGTPSFHEFKKQASFFFKEKIKTARLALTDVTPTELLTEEATNGNPWAPDAKTLKMIYKAAFEVDDYWRIVGVLHKRFVRFDRHNWRLSYNSLIVLEHLLTHGPESVAEEFLSDKDVISEMGSFQHIDEKGFNWGLNVRKKSERILKLLEKGPLLKEERDRARKLTRGIEGFGSFCNRKSSILHEQSLSSYGRCNSQFNDHGNQEDQSSNLNNIGSLAKVEFEKSQHTNEENVSIVKKVENSNSSDNVSEAHTPKNFGARVSFKENTAPKKEALSGESKPLLGGPKDYSISRSVVSVEEDNPFDGSEIQSSVSLLSNSEKFLKAC